ncbi:hypothetical protein [Paenibacillus sp. BK033]|uniref:hypothetical protein n=1 Tax=Paenibacillus sp. BK033 TaxID=2512133 RepID=UPI00104D8469|nr:hypothetical protein [Paenibacillus sp. BK033]
MSATSRPLFKSAPDGAPAPQYYNPATDAYEPLQGSSGASNVRPMGADAKGKATISLSNIAVGLGTVPTGATQAYITTESADIRFWVDGSTPTTSQGHLVLAGEQIILDSAGQLSNFKAITVSGTATLQVTYS